MVHRRMARLAGSLVVVVATLSLVVPGAVLLSSTPAGAAPVTTNFVSGTLVLGGWTQLTVAVDATVPVRVGPGDFTLAITPQEQTVPTTNIGFPVADAHNLQWLIPIPVGATFVSSSTSGTGTWTGGTESGVPATGTFPMSITECPADNGTTCTATPQNLTAPSNEASASLPFAGVTTTPYLEISTGGTYFPSGATLTFPTLNAVLDPTGPIGTELTFPVTEYDSTIDFSLLGESLPKMIVAWPTGTVPLPASELSFSSPEPPFIPVTLASTVIDPGLPAPDSPTIGTATANPDGTVTVDWTDPVTGAPVTSYIVQVDGPGGPFTGTTVADPAASSATIGGLVPGTTYSFVVDAVGNAGVSADSGSVSATTVVPAPSPPTIGTATANQDGTVTVTWTDPIPIEADPVTSYTVVVDGPGGPFTGTDVPATSTSIATVGGLQLGATYTFSVTATTAGGTSMASSAVSATTVSSMGTPLPVGAVGGPVVAVLIGAIFFVAMRRRRRAGV